MIYKKPMNVIEKIFCHHAIGLEKSFVSVGDIVCVKADWTLASELTFQGMEKMYSSIERPPLHRPDRFWLAIDHTVDPRVNDQPKQRALIETATTFANENKLTDFWEPNTTIMHTEFVRKRAQPGQIIIGADSHTCSAGGMGAFATGLGAADVVMPLVTGQTWFKVPEVVFIEFIGEPLFGIGGKDIILYILSELKRNTVAFERAVYYAGAGMKYLSDDARFALANMTTEFGGLAGVCEADEITASVLNQRLNNNTDSLFFRPDPNCSYAAHHVIDLSKVMPLIALYPSPDNCVKVVDKIGMELDGCFIGACTTTQEDLILAALVLEQMLLEGKIVNTKKNPHRRVTPGSLDIINYLKSIHLIEIYEKCGFTVGVPSCSYCVGIGADVAKEGEVWLSSQNRNFRNRMGKGSIGNLASAACVAASSFDMKVTDPMPYLQKIDKARYNTLRKWQAKKDVTFQISEPSPELILSDDKEYENKKEYVAATALESSLPSQFSGRVHRFGDDVDTDAIIPAQFMGLNPLSELWPTDCKTEDEVLAKKSFAYVRPDFVKKVYDENYTIIVAGTAFGSGSSREEAARCLKHVGIKAVIAKSFAYIYARNQSNNGLLGIIIKENKFYESVKEGTQISIDLPNRIVTTETLPNEKFIFSLTTLEENLLYGGGLKNLFKRYKKDLFKAAIKEKNSKMYNGKGCQDTCSTNNPHINQQIQW